MQCYSGQQGAVAALLSGEAWAPSGEGTLLELRPHILQLRRLKDKYGGHVRIYISVTSFHCYNT